LRDGADHLLGLFDGLVAFLTVGARDGQQHAAEAAAW
jgi:hypothetical protein